MTRMKTLEVVLDDLDMSELPDIGDPHTHDLIDNPGLGPVVEEPPEP